MFTTHAFAIAIYNISAEDHTFQTYEANRMCLSNKLQHVTERKYASQMLVFLSVKGYLAMFYAHECHLVYSESINVSTKVIDVLPAFVLDFFFMRENFMEKTRFRNKLDIATPMAPMASVHGML